MKSEINPTSDAQHHWLDELEKSPSANNAKLEFCDTTLSRQGQKWSPQIRACLVTPSLAGHNATFLKTFMFNWRSKKAWVPKAYKAIFDLESGSWMLDNQRTDTSITSTLLKTQARRTRTNSCMSSKNFSRRVSMGRAWVRICTATLPLDPSLCKFLTS